MLPETRWSVSPSLLVCPPRVGGHFASGFLEWALIGGEKQG